MTYRPTTIRPRMRTKTEETPVVIDMTKEFNQVSMIALELQRLTIQYKKKIEELNQATDETKRNCEKELKSFDIQFSQFIDSTKELLDKFSRHISSQLKEEIKENLDKLTLKITEDTVATLTKLDTKIKEVEDVISNAVKIKKGDPGEKGNPGISPDIDKVISKVLELIPPPQKGKDAEVDEEGIVKKLLKELLKKEIEIGKIKGLEERLRNLGSKIMLGGIGGGQGSWKYETPSGLINGINKVFTLSMTPATNSLMLHLNQGLPIDGVDYTLSGLTITFETAPPTDSILRAKFM